LDANNFFANRAGRALTSFKRNQFGASVGGPVYIPKAYNGRNRTFFFALYEGQRILAASLAQHTLPTDLERRGDFTQSLISTGQMKVIDDPTTTRANPAVSSEIRSPAISSLAAAWIRLRLKRNDTSRSRTARDCHSPSKIIS